MSQSVSEWVIVSDFGGSYRIYRACDLVLLETSGFDFMNSTIKNIISFPFGLKWFWQKHVYLEEIVCGLQSTQNICRDGWIPDQIELG